MAKEPPRPNPDALLERVREEEARRTRGRLKIFLGMAAGVGKTYAMLQEAHSQRADGHEVVVGLVETHGRPETDALLMGLEILPRKESEYRGVTLSEFDVDGALARAPKLLIVDELAHTNVPGSRHAKRWQDVQELLSAGIDVYTALNVQHIESLNDVVGQITHVTVRETVPDSILELADEIEVVDIPPDVLLQRLKDGKVYIPAQALSAAERFFRKGNLIALRELALRYVAKQVETQMETYRRQQGIQTAWLVSDRVLVAVSPSPMAPTLIRAARRVASAFRADWYAVYVETPAEARRPEGVRARVLRSLRLAEELGAKAVTLQGERVVDELLAFAKSHNVSKIVAGKPIRPRWQDRIYGSLVDDLVRRSGTMDVYIVTGEFDAEAVKPALPIQPKRKWPAYLQGVAIVGAATLLCWLCKGALAKENLLLVYLLGVVVVATLVGRGPAILASLLSVGLYDFLFVPPVFSFAVSDGEYMLTFAIVLIVALTLSTLTDRVRSQAEAARMRERRTATLNSMSRELVTARDTADVLRIAAQHLGEAAGMPVTIHMPGPQGHLVLKAGQEISLDAREEGVAQWAYDHSQMAGAGTQTLPGAHGVYLPLVSSRGIVGVLGLHAASRQQIPPAEQMYLLETLGNQTALALEHMRLADEAHHARVVIESERLRNALLSSLSHDLRTPLASITGAATSLMDDTAMSAHTRRELAESIQEEAHRLNRLVTNLLDMTRLESGAVFVKKEWVPLEEVIGSALARLAGRLQDHSIQVDLPASLPLVALDSLLIEQVFLNLLENAIRYTPPGTRIEVRANEADGEIVSEVADHGPGLPPGTEQRVFEKFFRAPGAQAGGIGLGLAICKGIVEAH
ncbi:MAG: sensor histidine kinase KdpD, partial [Cyanobacteria bacterium REEB65]|nr:sensor histidine kinase KdpD [Cyanobacteria bacterium REEB65]